MQYSPLVAATLAIKQPSNRRNWEIEFFFVQVALLLVSDIIVLLIQDMRHRAGEKSLEGSV